MSAQIQAEIRPIEWLESPQDPDHSPGPALREWLTYEGLLTVRLRNACPEGFRLELLDRRAGPGLMVEEDWIRRVILWCGGWPCVYAESFLPHAALAALPSLRRLGKDPLGETLQSLPGVSRGPFEFALLSAPGLPDPIGSAARGPLWARRSRFQVADSSLTVAETFLPGILGLPG